MLCEGLTFSPEGNSRNYFLTPFTDEKNSFFFWQSNLCPSTPSSTHRFQFCKEPIFHTFIALMSFYPKTIQAARFSLDKCFIYSSMNVTISVSSAVQTDICVTFELATSASSHLQISVKSCGCREFTVVRKRLNWKIIWWGLGKCLYTCWTIFHIRTLRVLEWNDQISAQFATDKVECRAAISTLKTGCRDALLNIYYKRLVEFTLNGKRAWKRYSLDYIFVLYTPSTVSILLRKIKSWKYQRIAYMLLQLSVELGYSLIRQNLLIENNVGMGWRGMSCLLISFCFK